MATTSSLDALASAAANTAMEAAAAYIRQHGLSVADYEAATDCLRRHVKAALSAALDDAKEAIEANMGQMAEATFLASMRLAGIEAAKEFAA